MISLLVLLTLSAFGQDVAATVSEEPKLPRPVLTVGRPPNTDIKAVVLSDRMTTEDARSLERLVPWRQAYVEFHATTNDKRRSSLPAYEKYVGTYVCGPWAMSLQANGTVCSSKADAVTAELSRAPACPSTSTSASSPLL